MLSALFKQIKCFIYHHLQIFSFKYPGAQQ